MKNVYFTLILIFFSIKTISAQSGQENKIDGIRTEAEYRKLGLLSNSDNFSFTQRLDTNVLVYKFFTISKRLDCTSEEINIYSSKKRMKISDISGYYFLGIKNDRYAIFDEGTSNTRRLIIYDLYEEKELINIVYQSDLVLKDNSILYKSEVKIDDEKLKPKCPPFIENLSYKIYLEEQYFDFQELKVIHTGKYTCSFME